MCGWREMRKLFFREPSVHGGYTRQMDVVSQERTQQEITRLLRDWSAGDSTAEEQLIRVVYGDLRRLAASMLRGERDGHTLQATDLVHEAFCKLVGSSLPVFESRSHFFGIAARSMRQLLVQHARAYGRQKRFDPLRRSAIELEEIGGERAAGTEVLAIHEALKAMGEQYPRSVRVVELRYFGGFSLEETAQILDISRVTAARDWALARVLLKEEIAPVQSSID